MTKQHKATPDDWAQQEDWANRSVFSGSSCLFELRARIEALEAGQQPPQDKLDRLIALDRDDSTEAAAQRDQPMTTDYRAELQRLVKAIKNWDFDTGSVEQDWSALHRAEAALAQPEPEGVTDEELWEMYELERGEPGDWSWVRDYARTVLARWGTPANALPTPEATNV
jgi:hypothetical protein